MVPKIIEGYDDGVAAGDATWRCIVTHTPSVMVTTKDGTRVEKIGIHVYFPEIYIDAANHLRVRSMLLDTYTRLSITHIGVTDIDDGYAIVKTWGDIIDKGVCSSPKLRLISSSKAITCFHTADEKKQYKCNGKGKHRYNAMRRYHVIDVFDWCASSGYTRNDALFRKYTDLNEPLIDDATEKKKVKHRRELLHLISLRNTRDVITPMDIPEQLVGENEDMDNEVLDTVNVDGETEQNVRALVYMLGIVDAISEVDQVHALGKKKRITLYKVYLHSRRCFNNHGDHTSNRIYVTIRSGLYITQQCFSKSETIGCMGVTCRNFQLPFYKYDPVLNKLLFGKVERPLPDERNGDMSHRQVEHDLLQFIEDIRQECVKEFTQFSPVEAIE